MSEPGMSRRQWLGLALLVAAAAVAITACIAIVVAFLTTCACTGVWGQFRREVASGSNSA